MATESPIRMLETDESKNWPSTVDSAMFASRFGNIGGHEGLGKQTSALPNRSGSAPPTVEGSIASLQTFMDQWNSSFSTSESGFLSYDSEEQMRTDTAYIAYYYANVNLNPRLPPPLISRENLHLVRLMRDSGNKKLTSVTEVSLATHQEESEEDTSPQQTSGDAMKLCNLTGGTLVEDLLQASSSKAVKGEIDHDICTASTTEQSYKMQESCSTSVDEHEHVNAINSHSVASLSSADFPSSTSLYKNAEQVDDFSTKSDFGSDISVLESRMESLNVSGGLVAEDNPMTRSSDNSNYQYNLPCLPYQNPTNQVPGFQGNAIPQGVHILHGGMEKKSAIHPKPLGVQTFMHNPGAVGPVPPLYTSTASYMNSGNFFYPVLRPPSFLNPQFVPANSSVFQPPYFGGYPQNAVPVDPYSTVGMFKQPLEGSMNPYASQMLYLSKNYPMHELMMRSSFSGSPQGQYYQPPFDDARRTAALHGLIDVQTLQKGSDIATLIGEKELCHPHNGSHLSVNYYGHPPSLVVPHFPAPSPAVLGSPIAGSNRPGPTNDVNFSQRSPKNAISTSDSKGQKGLDSSDDLKRHSFLELIKSCSSRKLELSDISGKIVGFSSDQHGSRFIQQKLEHCSIEEKESVFKEVIPHASKLMTDVFGNYVIQKFFEHGNAEQRRMLGEQLNGQILALSLQMYGCRVIQKALEVIELDQKTELIQELDGHVMRCVHDQNGNHVIQKCIESVPTERVRFIISSFRGQVAMLSCHPYGCRVIQRVLEHCSDEQICRWMIEEILESTCDLSQDPYGNYVTQHILETGKPQERSEIIRRSKGKFIQMSQHKYASNVVEKCLKYGDASEQDLIIEEIVAQPNNGDALLKMLKDQFGNYVVQKIFDMGNNKQKDILLKFIQTHLPALKKFPYAKHIVARYEQLSEGSSEEHKQ